MSNHEQLSENDNTLICTNNEEELDEEERHYLTAVQLVEQGMVSTALKAAVELGVFVIIDRAGSSARLSPREIAAQLPASRNPEAPVMLDRVLRLLATNSVVTCSVERAADGGIERRYGLGPVAKFFVPDQNGGSLGPYLSLVNRPVDIDSWNKFNETLLEGGIALDKAYGKKLFETSPATDPIADQLFNAALSSYSTIIARKLLLKYKGFESINQLVDVGGGLGHVIHAITSKYPSIKGINFDLPHVVSNAQSYPGVEHVGGDMFEGVPEGDAIFMKSVLHDWNDERCLTILKNCYKAVPENGKVILVESVHTDEPETTAVAKVVSRMDVCMMVLNGGAKERTRTEFSILAKAAGFAGVKFVCRVYQYWVMEFYK